MGRVQRVSGELATRPDGRSGAGEGSPTWGGQAITSLRRSGAPFRPSRLELLPTPQALPHQLKPGRSHRRSRRLDPLRVDGGPSPQSPPVCCVGRSPTSGHDRRSCCSPLIYRPCQRDRLPATSPRSPVPALDPNPTNSPLPADNRKTTPHLPLRPRPRPPFAAHGQLGPPPHKPPSKPPVTRHRLSPQGNRPIAFSNHPPPPTYPALLPTPAIPAEPPPPRSKFVVFFGYSANPQTPHFPPSPSQISLSSPRSTRDPETPGHLTSTHPSFTFSAS